MSNSLMATAVLWSLLLRHRYRLIKLFIKLCIKLLNAILAFLYR